MTHAEAAGALVRLAEDVARLKGRGDRFVVERHKIERRMRDLAEEIGRLDPERRRKSFQTGIVAVKGRIVPVRVRRAFLSKKRGVFG